MSKKHLVFARDLKPHQHIRIEGQGEPTREIVTVEQAQDRLGTDSVIVTVEKTSILGVNANTRFVFSPGYGAIVFDEPQGWVR